jgi:hypothetical protein
VLHPGKLTQRNLRTSGRRNENLAKRLRVRPVLRRVSHPDGKSLTAFDGRGQCGLSDGRFDHLLDVGGTLRRVRELLTERGQLFVDIVDFRAAYLRNWSLEDATKIDHPYYMTQHTMQAYLRRAGFAVTRVDYAADHLHVSYLCRPAEPDAGAVPAESDVRHLCTEMRFVLNAPRPR